MTRFLLAIFISLFFCGCGLQNRELSPEITLTACFKASASLRPTSNILPMVEILNGDSTVFDFVRAKSDNQEIVDGDTVTTADTDFYERVTFAIKSDVDTFSIASDSLKYLNGYYEFHGGESPLPYTDFKIRKGFIRGHRQDGNWIIEASIGVVDRQKKDSVIQEIKFKETFKNCN
jgi:hypothetical protein